MRQKDNSLETPRVGILRRLQTEIPGVLVDRPVMLAYLYGSVVDERTLPSSDLDIGLVLDPGCSLSMGRGRKGDVVD